MSKQICLAAGGELKLQSEPMIGSNFSFTMVVKPVAPAVEANTVTKFESDSSKLPALPGIIKPNVNVRTPVTKRSSHSKRLILNYESISINAEPNDIDSDSVIDEEEVKL